MTMPVTPSSKRSVWPYAIIVVFVLFAAYIGFMVYQAMHTNVNLVSADYYQQELAHQQRMDAVVRTAALPTPVQLRHEDASRRLTLQLPAALARQTVRGQVHFFRPSDESLDFSLPLQPAANRQQVMNTRKMAPGLWRVQLEFTAGGQAYFLEQDLTLN